MIWALIYVALLLLGGFMLRAWIPLFRWLYLPPSVIAGLLGLLVFQGADRLEPPPEIDPSIAESARLLEGTWRDQAVRFLLEIREHLAAWPGWLIAVVFAALLLERRGGRVRDGLRRTFSQVIMVWIIVVGQTAVGLWITWLFIQPQWSLPNSFAMLIETGFAGGHGTAAAMGQVFSHPAVNLQEGLSLGLVMATVGLIYGFVSGIFLVNLGIRRGWTKRTGEGVAARHVTAAAQTSKTPQTSKTAHSQRRPLGYEVISSDVMETLLLQVIWLSLAVGMGLLFRQSLGFVGGTLEAAMTGGEIAEDRLGGQGPTLPIGKMLGTFPLFIYTLLGGWILRHLLHWSQQSSLLEPQVLSRLSAVAMEILVVAAIASLNLQSVIERIGPLALLILGGCLWTGFCLLVLSRRILPPQHWFELGLINYGMSTGTTATGFVLLRMVDPKLETDAPEDYALAAPFSAPFIGGGIMTAALPLLVLERFPISLCAILSTALVIGLTVLGLWLQLRQSRRL